MKCLRFNSAMIHDKVYGPHEHSWGGKCVICGEIVDQVILENRQLIKNGPTSKYERQERVEGRTWA